MNNDILNKHLDIYLNRIKNNDNDGIEGLNLRNEREIYYRSFDKEKIINMSEEVFYEYISKLWAMIIWGNKQYRVNQFIEYNGFKELKKEIAYLLYGNDDIDVRWDTFKSNVKGFGPAMMSELLCYIYPNEYMIWNNTAKKAYTVLGIKNVPTQNYQLTGKKYLEMNETAKEVQKIINQKTNQNYSLLFVDYFFWDQLKDDDSANITKNEKKETVVNNKSYHNEIIDYIKSIGTLLGYNTDLKGKVGDTGKIADAIWEFNVGNIGKIKYVFEVQDSGSIDSLIVSLMNASQDISVQAVVAISDKEQIEKIKQHCKNIKDRFNGKIKYWDIEEVEQAYNELSESMGIINKAISTSNE